MLLLMNLISRKLKLKPLTYHSQTKGSVWNNIQHKQMHNYNMSLVGDETAHHESIDMDVGVHPVNVFRATNERYVNIIDELNQMKEEVSDLTVMLKTVNEKLDIILAWKNSGSGVGHHVDHMQADGNANKYDTDEINDIINAYDEDKEDEAPIVQRAWRMGKSVLQEDGQHQNYDMSSFSLGLT